MCGVLVMVSAVLDNVLDINSGAHHACWFFLKGVRFETSHHFVVRGVDSCTNGADVLVVFGSVDERLSQQITNKFMSFEGGLVVEDLLAQFTRQTIPFPALL